MNTFLGPLAWMSANIGQWRRQTLAHDGIDYRLSCVTNLDKCDRVVGEPVVIVVANGCIVSGFEDSIWLTADREGEY